MNPSKVNDPRSWYRWVASGAVKLTKDQKNIWADARDEFLLLVTRKHYRIGEGVLKIMHLCECVAGIDLKLIGTSYEELALLRWEDLVVRAKELLVTARKRAKIDSVDLEIEYIPKYVSKAGITLRSIGTSEQELKQLLREGYIAGAEHWLNVARKRERKNCVDLEVEAIREYVSKAGITLESIGTSEQELEPFFRESCVVQAKKWLNVARERARKNCIDSEIELVREYAGKAGVTLESIGISEQELEQLPGEIHIARARHWLKKARKEARAHIVDTHIDAIRECVVCAEITMELIGTSEQELKRLLVKGYIAGARRYLRDARKEAKKYNVAFAHDICYIRKYVKKAGATLKSIGTSEEELWLLIGKPLVS